MLEERFDFGSVGLRTIELSGVDLPSVPFWVLIDDTHLQQITSLPARIVRRCQTLQTRRDITPPSVPTGLQVQVSDQIATVSVNLHPNADFDLLDQTIYIVDDIAKDETQAIQLSDGPAVARISSGSTQYTFLSVPIGSYWAKVYARDNLTPANVSAEATPVPFTIVAPGPTLPAAPTGTAAVQNDVASNKVTWTNVATDADSVEIHRVTGSNTGFTVSTSTLIATLAPDVVEYIDNGAVAGTQYSYRPAARNVSGLNAGPGATVVTMVPPGGVTPWFEDDFTSYATADAMNNAYAGGNNTTRKYIITDIGSAGLSKQICRYDYPGTSLIVAGGTQNTGFLNDVTIKHRKDLPPNTKECWLEYMDRFSTWADTGIPNQNIVVVNITSGTFLQGDICTISTGGSFTIIAPCVTTAYPGSTHIIRFSGLNVGAIPDVGAVVTNTSRAGSATITSIAAGRDNSDWKLCRIHIKDFNGQEPASNYWEIKCGLNNGRQVVWVRPDQVSSNHHVIYNESFTTFWTGAWIKIRMHMRVNSAQGVPDGVGNLSINGVLVHSSGLINNDYNKIDYIGFGENRNQGAIDAIYRDWDYRKIYLANPGWPEFPNI